jgi:acetyl esterase/lipase
MRKSSGLKFHSRLSHIKQAAAGLIFFIIGLAGCGTQETLMPTQTPKPKEVEVFKDLSYLPDDADEHMLDLYLPGSKDGPFPILLIIHGGNGKKEDLASWGYNFARKGFAVVSINHRQWPDHSYPDHVNDAFCALAWIYTSQDTYNLDANSVFVMGHSAGGTLAALLGVIKDPSPFLEDCPHSLPEKEWVKGVISFTGVFNYPSAAIDSHSLEEYIVDLLGGTRQEIPEVWDQASATSWIDGSEPPFLLIHGTEDQSIPPQQSLDFADQLEAAGGDVELLLIEGANHGQIKGSVQSIDAVEKFILNYLGQRK